MAGCIFSMTASTEKYQFSFFMIAGILTGSFLRLYRIGSQIIWDDEWHGIQTALVNPMHYILTHFHELDNCIPLTAYYRIMLNFTGLNEVVIRLPQLLAGIAMLAVFPLFIKKLFGKRVAVIVLILIAISPLLVYFSRLARPYGVVVFLTSVAVFSFYLWMSEGKKIYALLYIISAVLAPYFSLSSLGFVIAPLLYVLMRLLLTKKMSPIGINKGVLQLKGITVVILMLAAGMSMWFLPAAATFGEVTKKNSQGFLSLGTMGGSAALFCGSNSYVICLLMTLFFIYGSFLLYAKNRLLFSYLCIICVTQLIFIAISRPNLVQGAIIFARYFISALPVWLLVIAIAIAELHINLTRFLKNKISKANGLSNSALAALFLIVFLRGPVADAYSYPNDFTNHKDFQYNYVQRLVKRAVGNEGSYPEFYKSLKMQGDDATIVEFPAIISWTWNIFHVYQRLHEDRVLIGYDSNYYSPFFGYDTYGNRDVGFQNFVDISDPAVVMKKGARYIIIHKDIFQESVAFGLYSPEHKRKLENQISNFKDSVILALREYVSRETANLKKMFGEPFYKDKWIVVYRVQ